MKFLPGLPHYANLSVDRPAQILYKGWVRAGMSRKRRPPAMAKKVVDRPARFCYKEWVRKEEGNEFSTSTQKILLDWQFKTNYNDYIN